MNSLTLYKKQLNDALKKRGHTANAILHMSPEDKFDEYCEWNGLMSDGTTLREIHKAAGIKS